MQVKKILIKDVFHRELSSLVVQGDELLINAIKAFTKSTFDGIFVVDSQQGYIGRIGRPDIIEWAKIQFGDVSGVEQHLYGYATGTRAKDLVRKYSERAFVKPDSPIADALKWMFNAEHYVLPVIEKDKIIGDVSLVDILLILFEQSADK